MTENQSSQLVADVHEFVLGGFSPKFGRLSKKFDSHPTWRRLGELGTQLWLDTGSIDAAAGLWTAEFIALTTNNTLLNREVQTGRYDDLIGRAGAMLADHDLTPRRRMLEMAFILNAYHGLRLVERFDAYVSVEEHTALAHDVAAAVETARRYHAICPERFIVKIPFTPAGVLATRKLSAEDVLVNHTLGFSARQNYLIARIGRPAYVNVFLGRLNSFVADNRLGDGLLVGERATLASQAAICQVREQYKPRTAQIGASFRGGGQVRDLAGIDVMTIPPRVAAEFLALGIPPEQLADRTGEDYQPKFNDGVAPAAAGMGTLWDISDDLPACLDELEGEDLDSYTPSDLLRFFANRGFGDLLVEWSGEQIARCAADGKIPKLENWRHELAGETVGLDSLMNLAGLHSFIADQHAMDDRVAAVLANAGLA